MRLLAVLGCSLPPARGLARSRAIGGCLGAGQRLSSLAAWPALFENTLVRQLRPEPPDAPPHQSRQVFGAHYSRVRPTVTAPRPVLVVWSPSVAESIGLQPEECQSEEFLRTFSGSPPATYECWATVYGASFTGNYGGQRGDGRAISIGQCAGLEIQLKGAGVTPYSRQFDGRAVLRSTVREFLASEAMAALRIPTTRSLCVISTGELVVRQWYDEIGSERVQREPGAVGTRVASSFLRFGQMELFYQRGDAELLIELAQHALEREFSSVQGETLAEKYVAMFDEICSRQGTLIAEWLRVGYCQGNMNSDNSALSGITLDYGPFAFMERFQPLYNPWVGGGLSYSFARQPQAAATNLAGLSAVFSELIRMVGKRQALSSTTINKYLKAIERSVSHTYVDTFHSKHDANCCAKLGFLEWDSEVEELWNDLFRLMSSQSGGAGVDFTNFFRSLSTDRPRDSSLDDAANQALDSILQPAALQGVYDWPVDHQGAWRDWFRRYWQKVDNEGRPFADRIACMKAANPKFILRNWMAAEAYEAAASGNYDVVRELQDLLSRPYDEQEGEADARWSGVTPQWARERPGIAFMS